MDSAAIEWDVPLWFWRDFSGEFSSIDWQAGRFAGFGPFSGAMPMIRIEGVFFHKVGLAALGITGSTDPRATAPVRGRPSTYDWEGLTTAIWGRILRGELIPKNQAQIEVAMLELLAKNNKGPSESTVRPYAKRIWQEFCKEA